MKRTAVATGLLTIMLILASMAYAQVTPGTPPWASLGGGPFDVLNLGSLNGHFDINVRSKAGRVTPFTYDITYDTSAWYPISVNGVQTWQPVSAYGWTFRQSQRVISRIRLSQTSHSHAIRPAT